MSSILIRPLFQDIRKYEKYSVEYNSARESYRMEQRLYLENYTFDLKTSNKRDYFSVTLDRR